jgi:hypothetical protein
MARIETVDFGPLGKRQYENISAEVGQGLANERIFSEFEQARNFQTFIFYIPPTSDFLGVKLMNLATRTWHLFDIIFTVSVVTNGKRTQTLSLSSRSASLRETPVPVGTTPALLRLKVRVKNPDLVYGQLNPTTKEMVNNSM